MRITEVQVHKEMKIGLPNFSNITASCGLKAEVAEGEKVDWDSVWDEVNREVGTQVTGIEPSWIQTREYQKYFKTTIRVPKENV